LGKHPIVDTWRTRAAMSISPIRASRPSLAKVTARRLATA
jgi:hypothetical protein